jgi:hypothetical protein
VAETTCVAPSAPAATRIRKHTVRVAIDTTWTEVAAQVTCQAGPDAACQVDGRCDAADYIVDDSMALYSGPNVEIVSGVEVEVWQETHPQYGEGTWRWAYVEPRPYSFDAPGADDV